jgi:hypothetical protein
LDQLHRYDFFGQEWHGQTMGNDLAEKKFAFLGAEKMGGIILQAPSEKWPLMAEQTCATVAHEERAKALAAKLKVRVGTNNAEAVKGADVILIAVKLQVVDDVVRGISGAVTPTQLIVGSGVGADGDDRKKSGPECPCGTRHAQYSVPPPGRDDRDLQRQARQRGTHRLNHPHL